MNRLILALAIVLGTGFSVLAQEADGIPADVGEVQTTASGLKYSVLKAGDGPTPKKGETVFAHYTGWLAADGKKFDSSRDRDDPIFVQVGFEQVIPGWDEGLLLMPVGSRIKFTIPWKLAYGAEGRAPVIPAKADLIFDVELLSIRPVPSTFAEGAGQKTESGIRWRAMKKGTQAIGSKDYAKVNFAVFSSKTGAMVGATDQAPKGQKRTFNGTKTDQRLAFLRECWDKFEVGGVYWLQVPPSEAFGKRGIPGKIAPDEDSLWRLEVVKTIPFERAEGNTVRTTKTGLEYEIIKLGKGDKAPTTSSRVKVNYVGWLLDGKVFDSSFNRGEPSTFGVSQVIPGWTEGLQLMKPGAIYRFKIPWKIAYGKNGNGRTIPPESDLIFWVELLEIL